MVCTVEILYYTSAEPFSEIDIFSTSAVHQSVQHVDFSLKIQKPKELE